MSSKSLLGIKGIHMGFFSNLFKGKPSSGYSNNDIEVITSSAQRSGEIINESLTLAYEKLANRKVDTPFTYRRLAILYRKTKNKADEIRILEEALNNIPTSNEKHYSWFQDRLMKIKA